MTMFNKAEILKALDYRSAPLLRGELERFKDAKGEYLQRQLGLLRDRGEDYLAAPIPELSYRLFKMYSENGNREGYEKQYFERRGRLLVFSLLCLCEPDDRWLDALCDTVWAICSEPYWCLPAHFMGLRDLPLPYEEYATQLDLFACETGWALAELLELCGERLPEQLVVLVQQQLEQRVIEPFMDADTVYRFELMDNNWSAVCAGAIGGVALYSMADSVRLSAVLHRCLSSLEVYLRSFGGDGVCTEGVDYWSYGYGFFVCFADLLCKRTGGELDLLALPKAEAIARSQQYFYLSGRATLSFSDGSENSRYRMGLSCMLQQRYHDLQIPPANLAADLLSDGCHRFCLGLRDLLWYRPEAEFGFTKPVGGWLPDAEWFLSAQGAVALAAKGGNNGESHNHNDCGSFILFKNGVPLLCDFGAGLYDADYFGDRRYEIFVNRSASHNLPMLGGQEQSAGGEYRAVDQISCLTPECNGFSLQLAGCYRCEGLLSFARSFAHRADGTVTLSDDFSFAAPTRITEVFVSEAPVELSEGCAVFTRGGESVTLCFEPSLFTAGVVTANFTGHNGEPRTAWRLLLSCDGTEVKCEFTIMP